ncbi:MAG: TetR/AcrR family transcriptional regulator [Acidobacteriota bacterium]
MRWREPKPETETESRILDAALEVFAQKGLHGATTKEIADRAGIQKSTVHYYHRHKEDLYATVFERAYLEMFTSFEAQLEADMSFRQVLRAFIDHHVRSYADNPLNVHLWMQENLIGAPVAQEILKRYQRLPDSPYRRFVDSLQEAIHAGEVREVCPAQTFITAMGACLFLHIASPSLMATLPNLVGDESWDFDRESFLDHRVESLEDLLWRGLRREPCE